MKAFDTDVLTEILLGDPTYVARAATIPPYEQAVPVIVIEELLRGRLHVIRQAEAGQAKVDALSRKGGNVEVEMHRYHGAVAIGGRQVEREEEQDGDRDPVTHGR